MKKTIAVLCGFTLLGSTLFVLPLKSEGAPAVIAFVAVVTTVATAVTVYDYNSCDLHIFWGCDDDNGANNTSTGGNGSGAGGSGGNGSGQAGTNNQNNNGGAGGSGGQACSSIENACGMRSTGFTNSSGVCAAAPPPVSSCPLPEFEEDLTAQPDFVRSGETTTLSWEVSDATACSLNGGGLNLLALDVDGERETGPITNRTEFMLTCSNGDIAEGAPTVSQTEVVNLVPTYQEQ